MSDLLTILTGDALTRLRELPSESVQCCVTSPPYWGLRDYGTGAWEGGAAACDHVNRHGVQGATGQRADRTFTGAQNYYREACGKCGAVRVDKQIGLEKTPAEFVAKMVEVFEEVRRVLKADGTCWVNLGDSYASNAGGYSDTGSRGSTSCPRIGAGTMAAVIKNRTRQPASGLKAKDLVGIPWRVAFGLQDAGWYLRSDIIWAKPNPMPESVTDRPTKSHEYLFLLTKAERYYYDADAIREKASESTHARLSQNVQAQIGSDRANGGAKTNGTMKAVCRKTGTAANGVKDNDNFNSAMAIMPVDRNKRTVWTVPTFSYSDAHFATYPPDLIKPCILAGSRPGDTVLDPFGGSGTTGQVALELGRKAVLIELNPAYVALIEQRCNVTPGLALS